MPDEPAATTRFADALVELCVDQLEELEARYAAGFVLPRLLAGHAVLADATADLVFTLGHLADAGVEEIAGAAPDDHIAATLARVDGRATHTFFSYRIAETLLRHGPFDGNPLLAGLDDAGRHEVALACDSSDWIALLDEALPRNYAAVLARCELARHRLGLASDRAQLDHLLARLSALLSENPLGYLDDSNDGSGRYDIYTADVWLFCEPLAAELGDLWNDGMDVALAVVDAVGCRDGSAVPWGRSTGVLSVALTAELAAVALAQARVPEGASAWLRRGLDAAAALPDWFGGGLCNAHQHRDQDSYRGPERRLQLTLDVLGKAAYAAATLRRAHVVGAPLEPAPVRVAYPTRDELVRFSPGSNAAAWTVRSRRARFVVPFVGPIRSHYLPALHDPGRFEVPVDADLLCWTPLVVAGLGRYTAGGVPASLEHEPGAIRARWDGFQGTTPVGGRMPEPLAGSRSLTMQLDGRSVVLDDEVQLEQSPTSVAIVVPETARLPLCVEATSAAPHRLSAVDVSGLAEWRSSWSEIRVAHQLELHAPFIAPSATAEVHDGATTLKYSLRVTPKLRVASTSHGHHYHKCLYAPITDRVVTCPSPFGLLGDAATDLADVDVFHMHWPEWVMFDDLEAHQDVIATLADRDIPIVWTAHNLTPHDKRPEVFDRVYSAWAGAAEAVIHHGEWGARRMRERYSFRPDCRHRVISHGHWAPLWDAHLVDRATAEARLGLAPCALRIGLIGAPRREKRVADFLEGVTAARRTDIQVVCWSLLPGETAPDDPRIPVAETYRTVDATTYATRLAACDVLALPFDPDGDMIATGTVFDAIAAGVPALVSSWPYLAEVLGDAGIPTGINPDDVAATLDALDDTTVADARDAMVGLRAATEWSASAEATLALFEELFSG